MTFPVSHLFGGSGTGVDGISHVFSRSFWFSRICFEWPGALVKWSANVGNCFSCAVLSGCLLFAFFALVCFLFRDTKDFRSGKMEKLHFGCISSLFCGCVSASFLLLFVSHFSLSMYVPTSCWIHPRNPKFMPFSMV